LNKNNLNYFSLSEEKDRHMVKKAYGKGGQLL
jgi:hypothetical protein